MMRSRAKHDATSDEDEAWTGTSSVVRTIKAGEPEAISFKKPIDSSSAREIARAMQRSTTLRRLLLCNAKLHGLEACALAKALKRNTFLETLDLSGNELEENGIRALADALLRNSTPKSLYLSGCQIDDRGAEELAHSLLVNQTLVDLDLGKNEVTHVGASRIAFALRTNTALKTLGLSANMVGSHGVGTLAFALTFNTTLLKLSLAANNFDMEGLQTLALGLEINTGLTSLNLNENEIGDEGALQLVSGLAKNTTLRELSFITSGIGSNGAKAFAEMLKQSPQSALSVLLLSGNAISGPGAEALAMLLASECQITFLTGLPELPSGLAWSGLWSRSSGEEETPLSCEERGDLLATFLLANDGKDDRDGKDGRDGRGGQIWTRAAHELASANADIFAALAHVMAKFASSIDPMIFEHHEIWLHPFKDKDKTPIIHALLRCQVVDSVMVDPRMQDTQNTDGYYIGSRAPNPVRSDKYSLSQRFCEEFLGSRLPFHEGLKLMRSEDARGRSVRSLALTNLNTNRWARTYGTYLGRFSIEEGEPVHRSKTCVVHYATEVSTNRSVALKIMRDKKQYDRETAARTPGLKGFVELLTESLSKDQKEAQENDFCLVMPRGSRSLFDAINTERFAGRDLTRVRMIAYKIACALQSLHRSNRIHGDIKPRNVLRSSTSAASTFDYNGRGGLCVSELWREGGSGHGADTDPNEEDWKLIDLDASVELGAPISEKMSTRYSPPEVARAVFSSAGALEARSGYEDCVDVIASESLDMWGFGVVLFELLSGTRLFVGDETSDNLVYSRDKAELMNWLGIDEERLCQIQPRSDDGNEGLDGTDKEIKAARDLVRSCLRGDPEKRIPLDKAIRNHPFFDDVRDTLVEVYLDSDSETDAASFEAAEAELAASDGLDDATRARQPQRASRRMLSIHCNVYPERFRDLRDTVNQDAAPIPEETQTDYWYGRTDLNELLNSYHFFLSHMQAQAAGIVKDLVSGLQRNQMTAWIDMQASEITLETMHRGVVTSQRFLMVLTSDVLYREFCLLELMFAVEHFGDDLSDRIFFLVEEDQRFSPWREHEGKPWDFDERDEDLETLDHMIEATQASLLSFQTAKTPKAEKLAREEKKRLTRYQRARHKRELREKLAAMDYDLHEVLKKAELAFKVCTKIPYRRRQYEEDAMLSALATHAGFYSLVMVARSPPRPAPCLAIVGKKESTAAKQLRDRIGDDAVSLAHAEVAVVLLEPGCKDDVTQALWVRPDVPCLVIENGWDFSSEEHSSFDEGLRRKFFDETEVLPWRSPHSSRENATYATDHEFHALLSELCHRAHRLCRYVRY